MDQKTDQIRLQGINESIVYDAPTYGVEQQIDTPEDDMVFVGLLYYGVFPFLKTHPAHHLYTWISR